MKAIAHLMFATALLFATGFAATSVQAAEPDLAAAEAASARNDKDEVIRLLLPAWNNGQLKDGRALFLLGTACFFQKHKLQFALNKAAQCNNRSGHIIWAAADAGNVDALLNLATTLDTKLAPLRHPDLPQDRAKAYRAALMAGQLAKSASQRERAEKAISDVGSRLRAAARGAVDAEVAKFMSARGMRSAINPSETAAVKPGTLQWLDVSSQRTSQTYRPTDRSVKVSDDRLEAESDAGVADEIDAGTIIRRGDEVQYVYSGMDTVVLVQADCRGGVPTLIWEADPYDAGVDGSLTFDPQAKQPIPRERSWIEYYWSLTKEACSQFQANDQ